MATSKKNRRKFLQRTYSFKMWHILLLALVFGAVGVYAMGGSFAKGPGGGLPVCSISPAAPVQGDFLTVTAKLAPVPADSLDGSYMVKNQTPYNTAYGDGVAHDVATGTATYEWKGQAVKGQYGFYFVYIKKGSDPDNVAKRDIIRVSQTCSVSVP